MSSWPDALRSAVLLVLDMGIPAALAWGQSGITLCNDAFADLVGTGFDPVGMPFTALGSRELGGLFQRAFSGETVGAEDIFLGLPRSEPAVRGVSLSVSPFRGADGAVAGVLALVTLQPPRANPSASFSTLREEAERVRAEAALVASEEKYRTLFQTMGQGFCELELVRDAQRNPIDFRHIEVNPAFERLVGAPAADVRGRRMYELVPGLEPWWVETYVRILESGQPARIEHASTPLKRHYEVSVYPQQNERLLLLFDDVTERKRAEDALREREERQALLLRLSDAVRLLADPAHIKGEASRLLAERLKVDRAYYATIDESAGTLCIEEDFARDDLVSLAGTHRLADVAWAVAPLRRGESLIITDMRTRPALSEQDRAFLDGHRVIASMTLPLIKNGILVGILVVAQAGPRDWSQSDHELLREVAERVWAAVRRARAETALLRKNAVLEGINRIFREALVAPTEEEFGRAYLAVAESITESAFSFMGDINVEEQCLDEISISDRGWDHFAGEDPSFPRGIAPKGLKLQGLFGRVFRDGRSFVTNDPQSHPDRVGTPKGHPPLESFLGVPLIQEGRIVGMIGLGNRPGGYRPEDVEAAEALAPAILLALHSKRTADTLRGSEERFRTLAELVPSPLWEMDPQGSTSIVNQRWGHYTGQSLRDVQGLGWIATIHPDDVEETRRHFAQAMDRGQPFERQHRIRSRDGEYRWFLVRHVPGRDSEGRVARWYGAATDIHDQYLAAETLRADEARQAFLLDLADRLQGLSDSQATLQAAVDALGRHIGVSRVGYARLSDEDGSMEGQARYSGDADLPMLPVRMKSFDPDIRQRLRHGETIVLDAIENRQNQAVWDTYAIRSFLAVPLVRDGSLRAMLYLAHRQPRVWSKAKVALVEDVAARTWDAVERAQAEMNLRASEARQRVLIEGIPQLVWRAGDGGDWTWASPQWCAYTGQDGKASRGFGWLDAIHPEDRDRARLAWSGAESASALTVEYRVRSVSEGRYRWFQSRALPVREADGALEWLGASTDIDDLRRLQEQQGVMVAELQHRTRNLITVVRSLAEQTMAGSASIDVFRSRFYDRLSVLSRVQGLLSRSNLEPITLQTLITTELDAMGAWDLSERIHLEGPSVRLRKATVQTFALALHELATNARKYGALANETGRLRVTWRTYAEDGRQRLALDWAENGINWRSDDQVPPRRGYGRELIEKALPYSLDARTQYELGETGLFCCIDLPLTEPRATH